MIIFEYQNSILLPVELDWKCHCSKWYPITYSSVYISSTSWTAILRTIFTISIWTCWLLSVLTIMLFTLIVRSWDLHWSISPSLACVVCKDRSNYLLFNHSLEFFITTWLEMIIPQENFATIYDSAMTWQKSFFICLLFVLFYLVRSLLR